MVSAALSRYYWCCQARFSRSSLFFSFFLFKIFLYFLFHPVRGPARYSPTRKPLVSHPLYFSPLPSPLALFSPLLPLSLSIFRSGTLVELRVGVFLRATATAQHALWLLLLPAALRHSLQSRDKYAMEKRWGKKSGGIGQEGERNWIARRRKDERVALSNKTLSQKLLGIIRKRIRCPLLDMSLNNNLRFNYWYNEKYFMQYNAQRESFLEFWTVIYLKNYCNLFFTVN